MCMLSRLYSHATVQTIKSIHRVDIVISKLIGSVSITMSGPLFTQYCVNRHFLNIYSIPIANDFIAIIYIQKISKHCHFTGQHAPGERWHLVFSRVHCCDQSSTTYLDFLVTIESSMTASKLSSMAHKCRLVYFCAHPFSTYEDSIRNCYLEPGVHDYFPWISYIVVRIGSNSFMPNKIIISTRSTLTVKIVITNCLDVPDILALCYQ